jgi:hypothetical protein
VFLLGQLQTTAWPQAAELMLPWAGLSLPVHQRKTRLSHQRNHHPAGTQISILIKLPMACSDGS